MLLQDIKVVFIESGAAKIFSKWIVESVVRMSDRPWTEVHKGHQITEMRLSRKLKSFGIASRTIRIGEVTAKDFHREEFDNAFARSLPPSP
jgi:hypothetical protein